MTCKNCIHERVCFALIKDGLPYMDDEHPAEAFCMTFRNAAWISVKDRLPSYKDGKVLIYTSYGISIAERTTSNRWKGDCAIPKLISHWMPLPTPPNKEK